MRHPVLVFLVGALLGLGGLVACGDSGSSSPSDLAVGQVAPPDLTPPGPDLGCYPHPETYQALLNACTTAMSIDKTPVVPLLNKDGTLPPLP